MKKILILMFSIMIILSSFSTVYAQEFPDEPLVECTPPSFWQRIFSIFRTDQFTIVGQDRQCDTEPYFRGNGQVSYFARGELLGYWSYSPGNVGGTSLTYASNYCPSGHGFYDVYCQTNSLASPGALGNPRFEMEDSYWFTCTDSCSRCNVELYCCPDGGCDRNSDCNSGEECNTEYRTDNYMPLLDPFTGNPITSYSFCEEKEGCTGADKTCWRVGTSNNCESSTYSCDYPTYGQIVSSNCASGAGSFIYSSQSICEQNLGECSPGETECRGEESYICNFQSNWYNEGKIPGKCGYTKEDQCIDLGNNICEECSGVQAFSLDSGKLCCIGECYTPPQECNTEADTNCDGIVSRIELQPFITGWSNGQVIRTKLGQIIVAWASS